MNTFKKIIIPTSKAQRILMFLLSIILVASTQPNIIGELGKSLRYLYGLTFERWEDVTISSVETDGEWLQMLHISSGIVFHALGGKGSNGQNTIDMARKSVASGYGKILEVDLTTDSAGNVSCGHPESEVPRDDPLQQTCSLKGIIELAKELDLYLVFDIKDDNFRQTAEFVLNNLRTSGVTKKGIFQLYLPDHVTWFNEKSRTSKLATPIISLYKTRRNISSVLDLLKNSAPVIAVDLEKSDQIDRNNYNGTILVFPIHGCLDYARARRWGASGFYMNLETARNCTQRTSRIFSESPNATT
jgi:hypothetical protein